MNLLLVIPSFRKWGGSQEILVMIADHFRQLGHRIVLASDDTESTLQGRFPPEDVHYSLPLRRLTPLAVFKSAVGLLRVVRREHIDLMCAHEKKASSLCVLVGRLLGVPAVYTAQTQTTNWYGRWLGSYGRNIVACSNNTKEYVVRDLGVGPEYVTVIHNSSPLVPQPSTTEIGRIRSEFGLRPEQPVVICAARLSPEKGHSVLFNAMLTVRREFPNVRLLVLGKGHLRGSLEEMVRSMGLGNNVSFAGYLPAPAATIACGDVAVLPSLYGEGFPLINVEYLRLGIPVVSSNTDGVPELIVDGETGLLVPPGDADALAAAICRVLRDPSFADRLAQQGRTAVRRFDPNAMCEQYEAYFAKLLGHPLRRPDSAAAPA